VLESNPETKPSQVHSLATPATPPLEWTRCERCTGVPEPLSPWVGAITTRYGYKGFNRVQLCEPNAKATCLAAARCMTFMWLVQTSIQVRNE
jgi:hypothetical protein